MTSGIEMLQVPPRVAVEHQNKDSMNAHFFLLLTAMLYVVYTLFVTQALKDNIFTTHLVPYIKA